MTCYNHQRWWVTIFIFEMSNFSAAKSEGACGRRWNVLFEFFYFFPDLHFGKNVSFGAGTRTRGCTLASRDPWVRITLISKRGWIFTTSFLLSGCETIIIFNGYQFSPLLFSSWFHLSPFLSFSMKNPQKQTWRKIIWIHILTTIGVLYKHSSGPSFIKDRWQTILENNYKNEILLILSFSLPIYLFI